MKKEPVFEIRCDSGKEFRIWANGEVDGFAGSATVVNRMPMIFHVIEASILEIERAKLQVNCQLQVQDFQEAVYRMERCLELFWQNWLPQEKSKSLPHGDQTL